MIYTLNRLIPCSVSQSRSLASGLFPSQLFGLVLHFVSIFLQCACEQNFAPSSEMGAHRDCLGNNTLGGYLEFVDGFSLAIMASHAHREGTLKAKQGFMSSINH